MQRTNQAGELTPIQTKEELKKLSIDQIQALHPSQLQNFRQPDLLKLLNDGEITAAQQKALVAKRLERTQNKEEQKSLELKKHLIDFYKHNRELGLYVQALVAAIEKTKLEATPREKEVLAQLELFLNSFIKIIQEKLIAFQFAPNTDSLSTDDYNALANKTSPNDLLNGLRAKDERDVFNLYKYFSVLAEAGKYYEACNAYLTELEQGEGELLFRLRENIKEESIARGLIPANGVADILIKIPQRLAQAPLTLKEVEKNTKADSEENSTVTQAKGMIEAITLEFNERRRFIEELEQRVKELSARSKTEQATELKKSIDELKYSSSVNLKSLKLLNEALIAREYVEKLRDAVSNELKKLIAKFAKTKISHSANRETTPLERHIDILNNKFYELSNLDDIRYFADAEKALVEIQKYVAPEKKGFLASSGKKNYSKELHSNITKILSDFRAKSQAFSDEQKPEAERSNMKVSK